MKKTGRDRDRAVDGDLERVLLDVLHRPSSRPMPQRELLHRAQVGREDRPRARRVIRRLLEEGRIRRQRGGRLAAGRDGREHRGTLRRHDDGRGFVALEDTGEKVFLSSRHLGQAKLGDRVAIRATGRGDDGRLHGVVTGVLEARRREILGVFLEHGRGGTVQPFDRSAGERVHVPGAFRMGAKHMEAVRVAVLRRGADGAAIEGKVLESLGHLNEPGTDVLVVARKYALPTEFPPEVLAASAELPKRVARPEAARRERFDSPAPVTIDGENARDFDDAVAVTELPDGGFRLFVHIADVGHFVRPGDVLDAEARRRGTSVYFPDRVLPMFPEALSNDLCSLRPGVDRLVQSAVCDISPRGKLRKVRFADGIIRSAARLTYAGVAEALEGRARGRSVPGKVLSMLRTADRLRDVLERRRHRRGSIDFDLPEPQILLDVEGAMTGIRIEPRNRAHRMIEEFMLVTNEAVAEHLERQGRPCLYRVHDRPDPAKLAAFASFVAGFGLTLQPVDESIEPRAIQRLIEKVEGRPEYSLVSQVALRSMKQARYDPENTGHFGLAAPIYCHFTSPIRRYPDLVVHRLLRAQRRGEPIEADHDTEALRVLGPAASGLERNAEAAERELLVWKKVAFIESRVGETFTGVVTGVARFGLFVQLVDSLVEGLIRVEWLGREWFEYDESRFELRGVASGRAFRLGDRLEVCVTRVDRILQRVDLAPAEIEGTLDQRGRPPRRRGRRTGRR